MSYSAIIFDFDGTLANTLHEAVNLYNELAAELGTRQVTHDELVTLRDMNVKQLLKFLGISKRQIPTILTRGRRALREKIQSLPLNDGIAEVLPSLKANTEFFGILTSNAVDNVEAFLEIHGIRDLFTFVSSSPKLSGKAKHIRSIARTFSLRRHNILYIGDEIRDVKAARKANVAVAAVTWGFNSRASLENARPRYVVDTPSELLAICAGRGD